MLCFGIIISNIQQWANDYLHIQFCSLIFIYIQIGCALVGSLGAMYSGVLLINLVISLFALVAIESSSQNLVRTYAVLLFGAILVDIVWFILFSHEIWHISSGTYGAYVIFSVKLTFCMQVIGFCSRLLSSLLWVQMYRLGLSFGLAPREAESDLRNSFLSPRPPPVTRRMPDCDEVLGGSVYDPSYYSSLFEDGQDKNSLYAEENGLIKSTSI